MKRTNYTWSLIGAVFVGGAVLLNAQDSPPAGGGKPASAPPPPETPRTAPGFALPPASVPSPPVVAPRSSGTVVLGGGGFGGGLQAPPMIKPPEPGLSSFSQRLAFLTKGPGAGANTGVLTIYSDPDGKEPAVLQEDMRVMSHLLEKAIEEKTGISPRNRMVLGIPVLHMANQEAVQSLYLEGYGALFLLSVNFPLLAPAGTETEKAEARTAADSEWEAARRELFGQHEPTLATEPVETYSEEKVAQLKTAILDALRNAANIRALKGGEVVTVSIVGGTAGGPKVVSAKRDQLAALYLEESAGIGSTMMTIRVKKGDVDAFSKGELSRDDFIKRAQVAVYTPPVSQIEPRSIGGYGAGGGSSYGGSTRSR